MQFIQAIILGTVQGLTEFIPISSSGHLLVVEKVFGFDVGSLLFDVMLHIGTLTALLIYFWSDIKQILRSIIEGRQDKLWIYLIIATFPAAVAGFFVQSSASTSFRSVGLVAVNLILVAILMLWVENFSTHKKIEDLTARDSLLIGIAQAIALIPGVSRSGATVVAGMHRKLTREAAAKFSFLLAIPITTGAILKMLLGDGLGRVMDAPLVFLTGVLTSAVVGYLTIKYLLRYLASHKLNIFAYYRITLGVILLLGLMAGVF